MSKKSAILVVDDEALILMALKRELVGSFGDEFLIETALDAVEANHVIDDLVREGVRIILIISDWLMPGVKGDEFLADVKTRHPDIRCIIISGQADPEAIARARELVQLDAFIQKPWSRTELLDAVKSCIDT
jgi:DNA-binding NtrC family response regulator